MTTTTPHFKSLALDDSERRLASFSDPYELLTDEERDKLVEDLAAMAKARRRAEMNLRDRFFA